MSEIPCGGIERTTERLREFKRDTRVRFTAYEVTIDYEATEENRYSKSKK